MVFCTSSSSSSSVFFFFSLSLFFRMMKREKKRKKNLKEKERTQPRKERNGGNFLLQSVGWSVTWWNDTQKGKKKKKGKDRLIPLASTPHKRHLDNVDRAEKMDGKKKTHRHKMAHDLPLNNKMLLKHSLLTQSKLNNNHVKINPKTKEKKVT